MKISIVTINYNNAEGLEKTIQSVVEQSYTNYEYIIIDGGSTDGSTDVIKKFADKIKYWVSEPDKGLYNAMNKGVAQMSGDYSLFLNSSDYFVDKDVLKNIFENKTYTTPIIRGNQITDFGTHRETWSNFGARELTLYDLYTGSLHHQATFFRCDLFDKYGLYNEDYKIVSDWEFCLKLLLGGKNSTYIDIDIVVYEYGGISSSPEGLKFRVFEREKALNSLLPKYLLADYKKLHEYNTYIKVDTFEDNVANFISRHKLPRFIFRVICKIYRILNID